MRLVVNNKFCQHNKNFNWLQERYIRDKCKHWTCLWIESTKKLSIHWLNKLLAKARINWKKNFHNLCKKREDLLNDGKKKKKKHIKLKITQLQFYSWNYLLLFLNNLNIGTHRKAIIRVLLANPIPNRSYMCFAFKSTGENIYYP